MFFSPPQFFDVAEVAIIHKTIFARFGYKLDMKVEKKKTESFYIRGYLLELIAENMAIWKKIPSKSGEFGPFFPHGKSFVKVEIIFFRSKFGETSLEKNTVITTLATNKNP
jgi:hypothetical protein